MSKIKMYRQLLPDYYRTVTYALWAWLACIPFILWNIISDFMELRTASGSEIFVLYCQLFLLVLVAGCLSAMKGVGYNTTHEEYYTFDDD